MKFIAVLLAVFGLSSMALADINVSGHGAVTVTPDNVVINVTVGTTASNMRAAVKFNAEETKKVANLLKNTFHLMDSDICTHSFSVSPNYETKKDGGTTDKIINYGANNQIIITVRDTSKAGDILGGIGTIDNKNAVRIDNINFVVSDTLRDSVLDQARKLAIKDALNRAMVYATAAGVKVGDVNDIREQNVYIPRYASPERSLISVDRVEVPVSAGTAKISVGVSVRFSIQGK